MAKEKKSKKVKNDNKSFMKDFKAELKKVVWPTSKQMVNNVVAVITIVLITAAIVFVLDLAFDALNEYGINKLKKNVAEKYSVTQSEIIENVDNTESSEENANAEQNAENTQVNNEAETPVVENTDKIAE